MPTLIFGVVVLILLLWAANVFAKADTSKDGQLSWDEFWTVQQG